jgi:hypothetical protein
MKTPCSQHDSWYVQTLKAQQRPSRGDIIWVGLTPEDWDYIEKNCGSIRSAIKTAEALLKEKNQ